MKYPILLLAIISANNLFCQDNIPSIQVKSLEGKTRLFSELIRPNEITVITFWATWCKPCMQEMEAISEVIDDWKNEVSFSFIAISVDDTRSSGRVKSLVAGKGWTFDFYLDSNQDLKRAMNISDIPFTIIVNQEGKIVYRHVSYSQGVEHQLINEIKKIQNRKIPE